MDVYVVVCSTEVTVMVFVLTQTSQTSSCLQIWFALSLFVCNGWLEFCTKISSPCVGGPVVSWFVGLILTQLLVCLHTITSVVS